MGCVCCWVEDGYIRWEGTGGFFGEDEPLVMILIYATGGGFEVGLDLVGLLEYSTRGGDRYMTHPTSVFSGAREG